MQDRIKTVLSTILRIVTSENAFTWLTGAIVFTFWAINYWIIGLIILCLMIAVSLSFYKDTSRVLSVLFMFVMIISADSHKLQGLSWVLFSSIGLLILGIIIHIIRFKPRIKPLFLEGKAKGFTLSLMFLCIPAALGGITRVGDRNAVAVLAAFGLFAIIAVCYLFFLATTEDKKGEAMLRYVLLMMLVAGIVMSLQVIVYLARLGSMEKIIECIKVKDIDLGWAGNNNVAPFLSLTLPAAFYYAIKKKYIGFLFIILAFFEYILIFATRCRGAIIFTTIAFPFMLCYTMAKAKNKLFIGIAISVCILVIGYLLVTNLEKFLYAFEKMFELGFSPNGRLPLYEEALEVFKKYPIFGAGWDYQLGEMAHDGYTPYWYHNTILQVLANMGIVGLLFFAVFFFWRYASALLTKNYRTPKLAIAAGLILFELYGMVDVNFFGPTFFISMVIMSFAVEKSLEKHQFNPFLYTKLINKIKKT